MNLRKKLTTSAMFFAALSAELRNFFSASIHRSLSIRSLATRCRLTCRRARSHDLPVTINASESDSSRRVSASVRSTCSFAPLSTKNLTVSSGIGSLLSVGSVCVVCSGNVVFV